MVQDETKQSKSHTSFWLLNEILKLQWRGRVWDSTIVWYSPSYVRSFKWSSSSWQSEWKRERETVSECHREHRCNYICFTRLNTALTQRQRSQNELLRQLNLCGTSHGKIYLQLLKSRRLKLNGNVFGKSACFIKLQRFHVVWVVTGNFKCSRNFAHWLPS